MNSKRAITKVLGYNMGKAAVDCYNQWFAVELANRYGDAIRMNALAPGFVDTEMTHELSDSQRQKISRRSALHRMPEPIDVAHSVVFLLGEAGRNITGTVITIDAGNTA